MKCIQKLPDAEILRQEQALTPAQVESRKQKIRRVESILHGQDSRKICLIGPCSADREDAVLFYMEKLADLEMKAADQLLIIPRIYTSKPRTNGKGYKGLLHRPNPENVRDNLYEGIVAARRMHLRIIQETGLFGADEMLYPEAHYYLTDLLAYTAVGARSVENQQHRLVASGLDMPVGMKNPTGGSVNVMLNAISAAQSEQVMLLHGYQWQSQGNAYAHAILRGYQSADGKLQPNYHYENLCDLYDQYQQMNLKNPGVIIDCNHCNSRKHADDQMRIGIEVAGMCHKFNHINHLVKGFMIESYLVDGCQMIGEEIWGKSITDPCLGWEKTERFIYQLCDALAR